MTAAAEPSGLPLGPPTVADPGKPPDDGVATPGEPEAPWVRRACREDAAAMGDVQVAAWRAGYVRLLPDGYLEALDVGERRAFWRGAVTGPPPGARLLVVCAGAAVIGFAVCGPEELGQAVTGRGQVYALNVHPDAWGIGAGSALLLACHERLVAAGFGEAVLWVLPGNHRARRLHERHGWRPDDVLRPSEVFGVTVTEQRYRRALP